MTLPIFATGFGESSLYSISQLMTSDASRGHVQIPKWVSRLFHPGQHLGWHLIVACGNRISLSLFRPSRTTKIQGEQQKEDSATAVLSSRAPRLLRLECCWPNHGFVSLRARRRHRCRCAVVEREAQSCRRCKSCMGTKRLCSLGDLAYWRNHSGGRQTGVMLANHFLRQAVLLNSKRCLLLSVVARRRVILRAARRPSVVVIL